MYLIQVIVALSKTVGSYLSEYLLLWLQHYTNSESEEYYHVSYTSHGSCVKNCRVILKGVFIVHDLEILSFTESCAILVVLTCKKQAECIHGAVNAK